MIDFAAASLTLLVLDFLWLYAFMGSQYDVMIYKIQGEKMSASPWFALASYVLMLLGLFVFVRPLVRGRSTLYAAGIGALFGLIVYGIYDFTAGAVLKNWDWRLAILDVLWGSAVFSVSAIVMNRL